MSRENLTPQCMSPYKWFFQTLLRLSQIVRRRPSHRGSFASDTFRERDLSRRPPFSSWTPFARRPPFAQRRCSRWRHFVCCILLVSFAHCSSHQPPSAYQKTSLASGIFHVGHLSRRPTFMLAIVCSSATVRMKTFLKLKALCSGILFAASCACTLFVSYALCSLHPWRTPPSSINWLVLFAHSVRQCLVFATVRSPVRWSL